MLNQNAFDQEPNHLWMATGRKKEIHDPTKASHYRRDLQEACPFSLYLLTSLPYSIKEAGIQTPIRWLF